MLTKEELSTLHHGQTTCHTVCAQTYGHPLFLVAPTDLSICWTLKSVKQYNINFDKLLTGPFT